MVSCRCGRRWRFLRRLSRNTLIRFRLSASELSSIEIWLNLDRQARLQSRLREWISRLPPDPAFLPERGRHPALSGLTAKLVQEGLMRNQRTTAPIVRPAKSGSGRGEPFGDENERGR